MSWKGITASDIARVKFRKRNNDEADLTCDKCSHSIENIEEQYDRVGVWYECELCEGGCNKGERIKGCPIKGAEE